MKWLFFPAVYSRNAYLKNKLIPIYKDIYFSYDYFTFSNQSEKTLSLG